MVHELIEILASESHADARDNALPEWQRLYAERYPRPDNAVCSTPEG